MPLNSNHYELTLLLNLPFSFTLLALTSFSAQNVFPTPIYPMNFICPFIPCQLIIAPVEVSSTMPGWVSYSHPLWYLGKSEVTWLSFVNTSRAVSTTVLSPASGIVFGTEWMSIYVCWMNAPNFVLQEMQPRGMSILCHGICVSKRQVNI